MSDKNTALTFVQKIAAPAAQLYHAFTNAADLQEWFADAVEAEARSGGVFPSRLALSNQGVAISAGGG